MAADVEQLAAALEALHARILEAQEIAPTEALRRQLRGLEATIGGAKTTVVAEYRRMMAGLDQQIADATAKAEAALQKAQEARAQLAAAAAARKEAKPPPPPEPPKPEIDPNLGSKLRGELLQRFGDGKKGDRPSDADHEIWEDWRWES
jgi:septal ring factor EnvC (AmiA/AmiB activator)